MRASFRHWLLLLVSTGGLAASLSMAQLILSHQNWRIDLTPERRFTLSDHTRQVLERLDRDVQVTVFLRSDDPRAAVVEDLLAQVHNAARRVRYAVVDVNRNPAVARQYGVDTGTSVVVESGGRQTVFVTPQEDLLVAAILRVTRTSRRAVYFLSGHGECDPRSVDRERGCSRARLALRNEFYDARSVNLLATATVPADAATVVIAGPQTDLSPAEIAALAAYVERGGGLLVMLDPRAVPRLTNFLGRYGVQVGDGVLVDPENRLFAGDHLTVVIPGLSSQHPVSARLPAPPLFSQARAVWFGGAPERAIGEPETVGLEILRSAPSSWRTTDVEVLRRGVATFAKDRDQPGPIPVGVSVRVEHMAVDGPHTVGRVIVLGDADFANNFFIEYLGDKDLLVNAVNWLAGEEGLLGQRPQRKIPGVNQFFVSARQGRLAFVLGTIVQPALVLCVGMAIFVWRRWTG